MNNKDIFINVQGIVVHELLHILGVAHEQQRKIYKYSGYSSSWTVAYTGSCSWTAKTRSRWFYHNRLDKFAGSCWEKINKFSQFFRNYRIVCFLYFSTKRLYLKDNMSLLKYIFQGGYISTKSTFLKVDIYPLKVYYSRWIYLC